jgi:hypothetical protein
MRIAIPLLLFAFQIGAIGYARFVPTRYFCWAPYDKQTEYVARATVNGKELTAEEFKRRYRLAKRGDDHRSPQHVIDKLEQVEQKRARLGENVVIDLKYRVNGKEPLLQWHWPPTSVP